MTVDAVRTEMKDAAFKQFDAEIGPVERPARDRGERCDPVKPPAMLGPEAVRVVERPPVHVGILSGIHLGASRPFRRHRNNGFSAHRTNSPEKFLVCPFAGYGTTGTLSRNEITTPDVAVRIGPPHLYQRDRKSTRLNSSH